MRPTSASVSVDRPIHDVFRFLAEGSNNPTWRSDVSLAAHIAGTATALGVGTRYFQKVTDRSGRSVEETYEITNYEPPHVLEFVALRGSTRTAGRYRLVAINPTSTHVEFTLEQVGPKYRTRQRGNDRSELRDRVGSISALPAAMRDEGALPL